MRIAAGLITFVLLAAHGARAQEEVDVSALAAKALDVKVENVIDPQIFERIGLVKSRLALNTLIGCCDRARDDRRSSAVLALRHFADSEELRGLALSYLENNVLGAQGHEATRALLEFGELAWPTLERVVAESTDEYSRRRAIGGFADQLKQRGTPEALTLLLEHYRPPFSGSAARGAEILAAFADAKSERALLKALSNSKISAPTRAIIVTSIAARPGKAVREAVVKALGADAPEVVVAAIKALEARGEGFEPIEARRLDTLSHAADPEVRFTAFRALARLQRGEEGLEQKLERAAAERDFATRMAAAAAMSESVDAASALLLAALIEDRHLAVRREAIEGARQRRIVEALPFLIARMDADGPRLRELSHNALIELTGLDHGPTPVRWRVWWEAEGATYRLPERAAALAAVEEMRARRAAAVSRAEPVNFYGVRLTGQRVTFVVDISGSMAEDGKFARMQRETQAALDALPEGAEFNLIFFATKIYPWGKQLLKMSAENRRLARKVLGQLVVEGGTNIHDALMAAYSDPDVETIVLLSDGEPTTTSPEQILASLREWDALRGIVVHTVSIGGRSLLPLISEMTGGQATSSF